VQPKERTAFDYVALKSIWRGQKLRILLDHVELAVYNRELVNWQVDENLYRDFVLSPVITSNVDEQFDWRRPLWEEFYPRVRHENSVEDAARIVARHLRERVAIWNTANSRQEVPEIWLSQITDETGFEILFVACLRSVGIPAKLDSKKRLNFGTVTNDKLRRSH